MNTCKNCGDEINDSHKYCSMRCRNIYVNKNLRDYEKNSSALSKKTKYEYNTNPKKCKFCEKLIPYEKRINSFCSKECRINSLIIWNKNKKGIKKIFSEKGLYNILEANDIRYNTKKYYENPKYCKECNSPLSYNKRKHVFCSIGCKRNYDKRNMSEYQKYYRKCQFDFSLNLFPDEFDFSLIEKYGWYRAKNHGNNLNGISRDHMISIKYGYENNINPEIIKHPANCSLMKHGDNVSKNKNCSITLNELLDRIKLWNIKYGALAQPA